MKKRIVSAETIYGNTVLEYEMKFNALDRLSSYWHKIINRCAGFFRLLMKGIFDPYVL